MIVDGREERRGQRKGGIALKEARFLGFRGRTGAEQCHSQINVRGAERGIRVCAVDRCTGGTERRTVVAYWYPDFGVERAGKGV